MVLGSVRPNFGVSVSILSSNNAKLKWQSEDVWFDGIFSCIEPAVSNLSVTLRAKNSFVICYSKAPNLYIGNLNII